MPENLLLKLHFPKSLLLSDFDEPGGEGGTRVAIGRGVDATVDATGHPAAHAYRCAA